MDKKELHKEFLHDLREFIEFLGEKEIKSFSLTKEDEEICFEYWQHSKNIPSGSKNKFPLYPSDLIDLDRINLKKDVYNYSNLEKDCFLDEGSNTLYSEKYPSGISLNSFLDENIGIISLETFESSKLSDQILITYLIKKAQQQNVEYRKKLIEILYCLFYEKPKQAIVFKERNLGKFGKRIRSLMVKLADTDKNEKKPYKKYCYPYEKFYEVVDEGLMKAIARVIGDDLSMIEKTLKELNVSVKGLHTKIAIYKILNDYKEKFVLALESRLKLIKEYKEKEHLTPKEKKILGRIKTDLLYMFKGVRDKIWNEALFSRFQIDPDPQTSVHNPKTIEEMKEYERKHYDSYNQSRFDPNPDFNLIDWVCGAKGVKSKIKEDIIKWLIRDEKAGQIPDDRIERIVREEEDEEHKIGKKERKRFNEAMASKELSADSKIIIQEANDMIEQEFGKKWLIIYLDFVESYPKPSIRKLEKEYNKSRSVIDRKIKEIHNFLREKYK